MRLPHHLTLASLLGASLAPLTAALLAPPAPVSGGIDARIAALEHKLAMVSDDGGGNFVVTGGDLRLRNGAGATATVNGKGNLILGYARGAIGGGSHNVVVGDGHTFTNHSGLVAGDSNRVTGAHGTVLGGSDNAASGRNASVSGGTGNRALEADASVTGGASSDARVRACVSGGLDQHASDDTSAVSGGSGGTSARPGSSVSGGQGHGVFTTAALVCGGHGSQLANNPFSAVLGGQSVDMDIGARGTALGGYLAAARNEDTVWIGGHSNGPPALGSTTLLVMIGGALSAGQTTSAPYGVLIGGFDAQLGASHATVTGGQSNACSGERSSISGGRDRSILGNADAWRAGSLFEDD